MSGVYNEYLTVRRPVGFSEPLFRFFHRRLLSLAAVRGLRSGSVLEVGFGFGFFAEAAKSSGYVYKAIDFAPDICEYGQRAGFNVVQGEFPKHDETPESYDVVWMSHVLEHAKDWMHAREMIVAAHSLLRPGGHLCIASPDIESFGSNFWTDWSHGYPTRPDRVALLVADVGFKVKGPTSQTLTVDNSAARPFLDLVMFLLPYRTLDLVFSWITGRDLFKSFMSLMGWRQVFIVCQKAVG